MTVIVSILDLVSQNLTELVLSQLGIELSWIRRWDPVDVAFLEELLLLCWTIIDVWVNSAVQATFTQICWSRRLFSLFLYFSISTVPNTSDWDRGWALCMVTYLSRNTKSPLWIFSIKICLNGEEKDSIQVCQMSSVPSQEKANLIVGTISSFNNFALLFLTATSEFYLRYMCIRLLIGCHNKYMLVMFA